MPTRITSAADRPGPTTRSAQTVPRGPRHSSAISPVPRPTTPTARTRPRRRPLVLVLTIALGACGGGGGAKKTAKSTTTIATPTTLSTTSAPSATATTGTTATTTVVTTPPQASVAKLDTRVDTAQGNVTVYAYENPASPPNAAPRPGDVFADIDAEGCAGPNAGPNAGIAPQAFRLQIDQSAYYPVGTSKEP